MKSIDPRQSSTYSPMKYWPLYFLISLIVLVPGTFSLIRYGLKPSIDFTGGTTFVWRSTDLTENVLKESATDEFIEITSVGVTNSEWIVTTSSLDRDKYLSLKNLLEKTVNIEEVELQSVGPTLGRELISKTLYSILIASCLILVYVATRFKNVRFGISAILAMLHDSLVMLGIFSLLGKYLDVKVDTLYVTAVLTTLSFSVHDTIVVFDRIRELARKHSYLDFVEIVNRAVVETIARSINNSMTIIFMLLAMYLMGGETIKWFIFALLIGTISGTYSSTFTAAPILVVWERLKSRNNKI